jgi:hypothetical protein
MTSNARPSPDGTRALDGGFGEWNHCRGGDEGRSPSMVNRGWEERFLILERRWETRSLSMLGGVWREGGMSEGELSRRGLLSQMEGWMWPISWSVAVTAARLALRVCPCVCLRT